MGLVKKAIKYSLIAIAIAIGLRFIFSLGGSSDSPPSTPPPRPEVASTETSVPMRSLSELEAEFNGLVKQRDALYDQMEGKSDAEINALGEKIDPLNNAISALSKQIVEAKKRGDSGLPESIKSQFLSWDGSHRDLVKRIKSRMHDAGSFEHVKTQYRIEKSNGKLFVKTTFRGNNEFGAKVLNTASAEYTLEGRFIAFVE